MTRFLPLLLGMLALLWFGQAGAAAATQRTAGVAVMLGRSVVVLNGPWRFQVGDDPRRAAADFDDAAWESVDLTPKSGANDGDVGYPGYVPGWNARGHRGYWGYAWYRLRVQVAAPANFALALSGPPLVDSAYQMFFDGRLLGGSGRFTGKTPRVFGPQPRWFALPPGVSAGVIAVRVWAGPGVAGAADAGGIHIAPAIGEAVAIHDRYLLQWRQTFLGYVVDVIPAVVLVLAAIMAAILIIFDRGDGAYRWMIAALLLTAAARGNQAVTVWMQIENLQAYGLTRRALLDPLGMGAWSMAWLTWLRIDRPRWIALAAGLLTAAYAALEFVVQTWRAAAVPNGVTAAFHALSADLRLGFVALLVLIAVLGARRGRSGAWPALVAMAVTATGLFAAELSELHVKGIWFPYGVGVSRTEIANVVLAPILFALLLGRLMGFAAELARRRTAS